MEKIEVFKNKEFGSVRTLIINDEPMFCLADLCRVLCLDASQVKKRLDDGVFTIHPTMDNLGRTQQTNFVNEDGLYDVILDSRKPEAKAFRKWVTSEVLPSIRKSGGYIATRGNETPEEIMAKALIVANATLERLEKERKALQEQNQRLIHSNKLFTSTEIAKELGLKSAMQLNNILAEKKIQFKQNKTWILYSKYADKGYVSIKQDILDSGKIVYDRKWSGLGRDFILSLLS